ncbi:MAG: type II toxin-antitoxin system RelE/ParE family toxin [Planctomycetes bacterium]|nr:type II toxin-antitoxin system RelE/ParE family toxin [Planctomycetota bacterium]
MEDLKELRANVRAQVVAGIETHLRHEPTKLSKSRIKRLRGLTRPQYRLRVNDVRVYYDVAKNIVEILAILEKSTSEQWLERHGER